MRVSLLLLLTVLAAPAKNINPAVKRIVDAISEERIAAIEKKLESFETRNIYSEQDHPTRGIGAARRWIFEQFQSYSPRLQVSFDTYKVKKQKRVFRDVEVVNVVAVLPGALNKERQLIVSGHYDSLHLVRKPRSADPEAAGDTPEIDDEKSASQPLAPGVTDDASGTAAVMELARVMSQYEFEKTIVFVAFAGEEEGLVGSTLYAAKARSENRLIDAVLNNDIIGSELAGNGLLENGRVRVFSEHPNDSPSRQLARYIKEVGERYLPSMKVDLIFRHDRFDRGGDQTPFNYEGYAAVRFTAPAENYENQHTATDTFANTSPGYAARVTRINAAAVASLALGPKTPDVTREIKSGPYKGRIVPNIGRGKSKYAALLKWKNENPEPDLAGYTVVSRSTTAPYWEKEIFVGNVTEYLMEDVSIDEMVFGVKAVDKDGNESLVSAYTDSPRPRRVIEVSRD
jgi:Peptidase family M28